MMGKLIWNGNDQAINKKLFLKNEFETYFCEVWHLQFFFSRHHFSQRPYASFAIVDVLVENLIKKCEKSNFT